MRIGDATIMSWCALASTELSPTHEPFSEQQGRCTCLAEEQAKRSLFGQSERFKLSRAPAKIAAAL